MPTQPTGQPTGRPSRQPTRQPTRRPTGQPTCQPTSPTGRPTALPTLSPSKGWHAQAVAVPSANIAGGLAALFVLLAVAVVIYQFCRRKFKVQRVLTLNWRVWEWDLWDDLFQTPGKVKPKPFTPISDDKLVGVLKYQRKLLTRYAQKIKDGKSKVVPIDESRYQVSGDYSFSFDSELDDLTDLKRRAKALRGLVEDDFVRDFDSLHASDDEKSLASTADDVDSVGGVGDDNLSLESFDSETLDDTHQFDDGSVNFSLSSDGEDEGSSMLLTQMTSFDDAASGAGGSSTFDGSASNDGSVEPQSSFLLTGGDIPPDLAPPVAHDLTSSLRDEFDFSLSDGALENEQSFTLHVESTDGGDGDGEILASESAFVDYDFTQFVEEGSSALEQSFTLDVGSPGADSAQEDSTPYVSAERRGTG